MLLSAALAKRHQHDGLGDENLLRDWKQSLRQAPSTFADMEPQVRAADKYGEVIRTLFDTVFDGSEQEGSQGPWPRFVEDISLPAEHTPYSPTIDFWERSLALPGTLQMPLTMAHFTGRTSSIGDHKS